MLLSCVRNPTLSMRDAGGADEQEGIQPARGLAERSGWPSAGRRLLQVIQSEVVLIF
jgi:hypothetical protein